MKPERLPVTIVGGGLAGLSLGVALRGAKIPVTIVEAGDYPRHRVCGEFIAGLDPATSERLGLAPFLSGSRIHENVTWYQGSRSAGRTRLPNPAFGISRFALDARLAAAFVERGGILETNQRASLESRMEPGRIFSVGRRREMASSWIGLKVHAIGLPLTNDLELHVGDGAYVGACAVEDNHVNVCGLFRVRDDVTRAGRDHVMENYLRACGLNALADRIRESGVDPTSRCAVAGLNFAVAARSEPGVLLGDAFAMIPPFTGNGMAMAFQSAATALPWVIEWSEGKRSWFETARIIRGELHRRFRLRLFAARVLHPFIHFTPRQRWFAAANRAGLLPLRPLYHALH